MCKLRNAKLYITCVILVMYSFIGSSQISLGLKGGVNYGQVRGNIDPPESDRFDNGIGLRIGLTLNYSIGRLKFGTGGLLSFRPTCAKYSFFKNECGTLHFTFIEIPISFYRTFLDDKIQTGISVINGFTKYPPISLIDDKEYEIDIECSLAWNINQKFNIEISYLFGGLNPLFSERDTHLFFVGNM